MKIVEVKPFILHVPVTRNQIADSTHQISHWGAPGVIIETDSGHRGYGYGGTHAHSPTDRLITDCIAEAYTPLLIGEDPRDVRALWWKLHHNSPIMWVGRTGITHLALSAVDIALWDLKAKAADMPLWKLLGGKGDKKIEAYNTDGGWLNWTAEQLVEDSRRLVEEEGYGGVKIKIGKPDPQDDLERLAAVRRAIGPRAKLMTDVNGRWDLSTAINVGRHLCDYDVMWIEEPLWFDNVSGHERLARAIQTPIALGEQLYTLDAFTDFISRGAVHPYASKS
ncbi:MAG: mandelate racemase/muconate lactonizing enzyme family protein [Chloroflexota bacterium]|nr:mandelate racemase/muconate lactonizing enzyme family protein [Chloroflexota bacterium]